MSRIHDEEAFGFSASSRKESSHFGIQDLLRPTSKAVLSRIRKNKDGCRKRANPRAIKNEMNLFAIEKTIAGEIGKSPYKKNCRRTVLVSIYLIVGVAKVRATSCASLQKLLPSRYQQSSSNPVFRLVSHLAKTKTDTRP